MLIENKKESGFWPGCLSQKDWYLIIDIQTKPDLKKRYSKEVQSLCKTSFFGAIDDANIIDKGPLDEIVGVASVKTPLLSSIVFVVKSVAMQLVRIL